MSKVSERRVAKNQRVFSQVFGNGISDIILDPGCSQFGQLPARPGKKTVRVMFDFGRNTWIVIREMQ